MSITRILSIPIIGVWLALAMGCSSPADSDDTSDVPGGVALHVEAQPSVIVADGVSRAVVFVEVRRGTEAAGDSTEVVLLRTLGTLIRGIIYTRGGVALDTLRSDTTAGTGWVIAYCQGVRDSVEVMFTER